MQKRATAQPTPSELGGWGPVPHKPFLLASGVFSAVSLPESALFQGAHGGPAAAHEVLWAGGPGDLAEKKKHVFLGEAHGDLDGPRFPEKVSVPLFLGDAQNGHGKGKGSACGLLSKQKRSN